jgi:hemoglobin-like flavoprotein
MKWKLLLPALSRGDPLQPSLTPDLTLTLEQRRRIRDSFDLLRDQAAPFGLLFYGKLFELDPGSRPLFHIDLSVQVQKLMDMLNSVVESLDNFEGVHARLAELGRKHTEYGVRPEHYQALTEALLWSIAQALGPDFDSPTREAWRLALAFICATMKSGA